MCSFIIHKKYLVQNIQLYTIHIMEILHKSHCIQAQAQLKYTYYVLLVYSLKPVEMEPIIRFAAFLLKIFGYLILPILIFINKLNIKPAKIPPIRNELLYIPAVDLATKIRNKEVSQNINTIYYTIYIAILYYLYMYLLFIRIK